MLYDKTFSTAEMLFGESSRIFVKNGVGYVSFSARASANFSEQYQSEIAQNICNMFLFNSFKTSSKLTFTIRESLDRIEDQGHRQLFVYQIFRAMYTAKFCANTQDVSSKNGKVLRYQKTKFVEILNCMGYSNVKMFSSAIYSAIVDSAEKLVEEVQKSKKLHKFAYKASLVAKEYLDDLEAFLEHRDNVGYPKLNKKQLEQSPFDSAENVLTKARNK